jgi:hypothetical protein
MHFNGFQLLCFGVPVALPEICKEGRSLGAIIRSRSSRRTPEGAKRRRSQGEGEGGWWGSPPVNGVRGYTVMGSSGISEMGGSYSGVARKL